MYSANNPISFVDPLGLCFQAYIEDVRDQTLYTLDAQFGGMAAPTGSGLLTAGTVASNIGERTVLQVAWMKFKNAYIQAGPTATWSSAAKTMAVNTVVISVAWMAGTAIGSAAVVTGEHLANDYSQDPRCTCDGGGGR